MKVIRWDDVESVLVVIEEKDGKSEVVGMAVGVNGPECFAEYREPLSGMEVETDHVLDGSGNLVGSVVQFKKAGREVEIAAAIMADPAAVPDRATINSLPNGIRNYIRQLERKIFQMASP